MGKHRAVAGGAITPVRGKTVVKYEGGDDSPMGHDSRVRIRTGMVPKWVHSSLTGLFTGPRLSGVWANRGRRLGPRCGLLQESADDRKSNSVRHGRNPAAS